MDLERSSEAMAAVLEETYFVSLVQSYDTARYGLLFEE